MYVPVRMIRKASISGEKVKWDLKDRQQQQRVSLLFKSLTNQDLFPAMTITLSEMHSSAPSMTLPNTLSQGNICRALCSGPPGRLEWKGFSGLKRKNRKNPSDYWVPLLPHQEDLWD